MEIPQQIRNDAVDQSKTSPADAGLAALLCQLDTLPIADFFKESSPAGQISPDIYTAVQLALRTGARTETERTEALAALVAAIRPYLSKAIAEADVRSVIIFSMVDCYLSIPLKGFLDAAVLGDPKMDALAENIAKVLSSLSLQVAAQPDAPPREVALLQDAAEGFAENDLVKAYQLIQSLERDMGIRFNYLYGRLMHFLYQLRPAVALRVLIAKRNPLLFAFYLSFFDKQMLLDMAGDPLVTDMWLNFETLRQLVTGSKNKVDDTELPLLVTLLSRIRSADEFFFRQTLRYLRKNVTVNAAVGRLLYSVTDAELAEIIAECYPVDQGHHDSGARSVLVNHFADAGAGARVEVVLSIIFELWKSYLDSAIATGEPIVHQMVFTDYCELIPAYYTQCLSDQDLKRQMAAQLEQVRCIDSRWAKSAAHQASMYWVYHTPLYLMSFAYKNKKLRDPTLEAEYLALLNHPIHLARYIKDRPDANFKKAGENMSWATTP